MELYHSIKIVNVSTYIAYTFIITNKCEGPLTHMFEKYVHNYKY